MEDTRVLTYVFAQLEGGCDRAGCDCKLHAQRRFTWPQCYVVHNDTTLTTFVFSALLFLLPTSQLSLQLLTPSSFPSTSLKGLDEFIATQSALLAQTLGDIDRLRELKSDLVDDDPPFSDAEEVSLSCRWRTLTSTARGCAASPTARSCSKASIYLWRGAAPAIPRAAPIALRSQHIPIKEPQR